MSAAALPALREELHLFAGGCDAEGAPTWNLHDPVRNQFFRIDWPTFEILARWRMHDAESIAAAVSADTTLELGPEDVAAVQAFLHENQLVQVDDAGGSRRLAAQEAGRRSSLWQWLLHHYLFFRVPLISPDRWLTRHLPHVAPFFSKRFFQLTALALVFGAFECYRQRAAFSATLIESLTFKGLLGYAVALTFVKVLHEFGHAFTAKRKGCRVPTMGVAFLVMWPVAYTDVNEVWKLPSRKDRFAVGVAGIVTELVVAAWSTLAWAFLPDGALRDMTFLLATTTWISTVAINASPFMRFDGYFLMVDWLDFPNLHARSFALARWDLRERLFALGEPVPEVLPRRRHNGLILFAWMVWIYRLSLFLGIAFLVYHFFIKLVGILLFIVEITVFVVQPIWNEMRQWRKRARSIHPGRAVRALVILGMVLTVGFVPWSTHVSGQGLLRPAQYFPVYSPNAAQIQNVMARNGEHVNADAVLMSLTMPDLEQRRRKAADRVESLRWQLEVSGLDEEQRGNQPVIRQELAGALAQLSGAEQEQARFDMRAPFAGVLVDVMPELASGIWVNPHERLGVLIDPSSWQVEIFLDENAIRRVRVGDAAHFFSEVSAFEKLPLTVVRIDPDATRQLPEPMLAAQHGGQIQARERNGKLVPEHAIYRVVLRAQPGESQAVAMRSLRGRVVIDGEPKSLLGDYLRTAATVVIREAGW